MSEIINNSASSSYVFEGSTSPNTVNTNTLPVNLESGDLTVTKTATPTTYSAGSVIAYSITITNSGSSNLTGVRVTDNLGSGHLAFVTSSASLTTDSQTYPVNPISTNPLTFTLQELNVGESMTLNYRSQVVFNLPSNVNSITNTVNAIGYTNTGTVTGSANATINRTGTVSFTATKSASESDVAPSQPFSYFITLTNNNTVSANVNNITDSLPSNFTLTGVLLKIGSGSTQTLSPSDYTLSSGNVLVVPSSTGPAITVPAGGTTVLTINGYLS